MDQQPITPAPAPPAPLSPGLGNELRGISRWRLTLAFGVAGVSDVISLFTSFAEPVQVAVDLVTAGALFVLLGWRWWLLPVLVAEAVPGLSMLPLWLAVVASLTVFGHVRKPG